MRIAVRGWNLYRSAIFHLAVYFTTAFVLCAASLGGSPAYAATVDSLLVPKSASPQTAPLLTIFATSLEVQAVDVDSIPIADVVIRFTAPLSGASGRFDNRSATIDIVTDSNGIAIAPFIANASAGNYFVTASTLDAPQKSAVFDLTNVLVPGSPAAVAANPGSTPQQARINDKYSAALAVFVTDIGGAPVAGTTVRFSAPEKGASGTFSNGLTVLDVLTDVNGYADNSNAAFTANDMAGTYAVTATAVDAIVIPAPFTNFTLTNIVPTPSFASAAPAATPQRAALNAGFAVPLNVYITDNFGGAMAGVTVRFTAPGSGASGTFSNAQATIDVVTDGSGHATASFTANNVAGTYSVSATTLEGTPPPTASFVLSNYAPLQGPLYPPLYPPQVTFADIGSTVDGAIGKSTGKTWSIGGVALAAIDTVYWGVENQKVMLSFVDGFYTRTGEILKYSPELSNPAGGVAVWSGQTLIGPTATFASTIPIYTRFIMTIKNSEGTAPLELTDGYPLGLPTDVGPVLKVTSGLSYQANLRYEASTTQNGTYIPAYDLYDSYNATLGGAHTSVDYGFYWLNTPPTISTVSDKFVAPNSVAGPYDITVGDVDNDPATLILSGSSSNTSLLPNSGITFGGSGTARTFSLTLAAGQYGTATVTISVSDGAATTSTSFLLTVNSPPTIAPITGQLIQKNSTGGPFAITVGDAETAPSALTLSGVSNNTALLPNSAIVFGGSGTTRNISVTPTTGLVGTVTVAVTVSDGISSASTPFVLTVNAPPNLAANNQLTVDVGTTATITSTNLQVTDAESLVGSILFTIASQPNGGSTRNGSLKLNGVTLTSGSTFTMQDISSNLLTYAAGTSCEISDDFQFTVSDGTGGVIPLPSSGFASYSFRIAINHPNRAPTVSNGVIDVPLGNSSSGVLSATDPDTACFAQPLAFRIVSNGNKGAAVVTNAATGAYTYTATQGKTGIDQFTYTVNDGTVDASSVGTITVFIANQPPVANPGTGSVTEGSVLSGNLSATDADRPAQTLTYAIATNGSKGTAAITNATTGAFTYTPNANAIGDDTFTFTVSDSQSAISDAATFGITIRPIPKAGDVIVSNQKDQQAQNPPSPTLVCVRPQNGHQAVISTGDKFVDLYGVTVEKDGNILVLDKTNGLIRVNPLTGAQTVLAAGFSMPINLTTEADGSILVGDMSGLIRVDKVMGVKTTLSTGGILSFPAGVVVAPDGQIYVTDVGGLLGNASQVVKIDPSTGNQSLIASGSPLAAPSGIVLNGLGDMFVTDGPMSTNNFIKVDHTNFGTTAVVTGGDISLPSSVAVLSDGNFVVANNGNGKIVQIDAATFTPTPLASGGLLLKPFGIAVMGTPPTISTVPDQLIQKGGNLISYPFTIGDAETSPVALVISATSSNKTLLPDNGISVGGSSSNRTISAFPSATQAGTTTVTLSVSDGTFTTRTSFVLTVNAPPVLAANNQINVNVGGTVTITNTNLRATDENPASGIIFTIGSQPNGGPPHNGTLNLNGVALASGSTFTMQDVNNNLLTYTPDAVCSNSDDFQFNITDGVGGVSPTGANVVYSFRIAINRPNQPPSVPAVTAIGVPLGNGYSGFLTASDPDSICVTPILTYRIVSNGSKGTAVITNNTTGAFTYTANQGASGADSFTYIVDDGVVDALAAGTVQVTIANQPPVATPATGSITEGGVLTGALSATDADRPVQTLTYAIANNGSKGTAVITNATTGAFSYTPTVNSIGEDTFTFTVTDGLLTSAPATFKVAIRPIVKLGDLIVTNQKVTNGVSPTLVCIRPQNGHQAVISTGGMFVDLLGVAVERNGNILVLDKTYGLLRVDPQTGAQTVVSSGPFANSIGVAVEASGNILAFGQAGLLRIDPVTGQNLAVLPASGLSFPAGITIATDGQLYVADVGALAGKSSRVVQMDPVTGNLTEITSSGNLMIPSSLVFDNAGNLFVTDGPVVPPAGNNIVKIAAADNTQSLFSANGSLLAAPSAVTALNGNLVVVSSGNKKIVLIDSVTGVQSVITSDELLLNPFGIAAVSIVPPAALSATNITASGFTANWSAVSNATGYRLDVATDPGFSSIVSNYNNIDAGAATSFDVNGMVSGNGYFYRVRAYNGINQSRNSATVNVKTDATLNVTIVPPNAGTNTVTSSPVGISCHTGTANGCSAAFVNGGSVTLSATPSWNYVFSSWGGDCSVFPCILDQSKNVTATFAENLTVKLLGTPASYYSTLAGAYAAATGSLATIQAQAFTYHEQLTFGSPVTVVLDGGNDNNFVPTTGYTTVMGTLKVKAGKVIGNRIKIQ